MKNPSTSDPEPADKSHRAHQRLLHVLPAGEESRALGLLEIGLHSAVQIANMPKPTFLAQWATLFPGEEELGEVVYQNAVARRAFVALHYVRKAQGNEPHYRAARFR
jgi:hypothetical protein